MNTNDLTQSKVADSKGRVTLGKEFANRTFIFRYEKNEITLIPARVIPEEEMWLYENKEALASVKRGIAQAAAGQLTEFSELDADSEFANSIEDD